MGFESVVAAPSPVGAARRRVSPWRLGAVLWALGMPGVVAVVWALLPPLVAHQALLPLPLWAMVLVSGVQTALLLAIAVWVGVVLSRRLGLDAPAISTWVQGHPVMPALKAQWVPALWGGLVGAAWLWGSSLLAPDALRSSDAASAMPWIVKLLYGGITEELLVRWGAMTLLLWLAWRVVQRGQGAPRKAVVVGAVTASALLFALGHLPAAYALAGDLTPPAVALVLLGNTAFGAVAGGLYARYGLESAIVAHVLAHALSSLLL